MLSLLPNFSDWPTALAIFVIPLTVNGGRCGIRVRNPAVEVTSRSACWRPNRIRLRIRNANVRSDALRAAPVAVDRRRAGIDHRVSVAPRYRGRFPNVHANLIGNDIAYPAMLVFLPAGFAGFMVAGLFAAYRSTIETHLNWGTSYLVHDFFQRFVRPGATQRELVLTGRLVTVGLMAAGVVFSLLLITRKARSICCSRSEPAPA